MNFSMKKKKEHLNKKWNRVETLRKLRLNYNPKRKEKLNQLSTFSELVKKKTIVKCGCESFTLGLKKEDEIPNSTCSIGSSAGNGGQLVSFLHCKWSLNPILFPPFDF